MTEGEKPERKVAFGGSFVRRKPDSEAEIKRIEEHNRKMDALVENKRAEFNRAEQQEAERKAEKAVFQELYDQNNLNELFALAETDIVSAIERIIECRKSVKSEGGEQKLDRLTRELVLCSELKDMPLVDGLDVLLDKALEEARASQRRSQIKLAN